MKLACVLALLAVAGASSTTVTPVQKVIQLMEGMVAKGEEEKHAEQVQFAAYKTFCEQTSAGKASAIAEAAETIEILTADIEKYEADAAALAKGIAELDEDISGLLADQKAATAVRDKEHADFLVEEKDHQESVEQMGKATSTVEAEAHDTAQTAFLQQVAAMPAVDAHSKKLIQSYLAQDADELDAETLAVAGPPQANAAEFKSQGILDMFGKLSNKFEKKLADCREEEMNNKHAYDMLMMDLKNSQERAEADRADKATAKGKALQNAGAAKADKADTEAAKAADEKFKADLDATCAEKASDFAERQQLRTEELEAVNKAIEIMGGDAVAGSADKHLPALMQTKKAALVQLRASVENPNQVRVASFLRSQADRINSKVLSALAMRVQYDPFKSVKKMIKDMVVKLMEEANAEAEHKGWCDTELSTNEQTRKEKTSSVETLTAEADELEATVAQLAQEITELTQNVADLDAAIAEATKIREEEKAKNTQTIADAKAAQTAVAQALTVLKDFYEKAGEATALVQTKKAAKQPEIFDAPYTGMQGASGGVVGMVEVIQSDFERLETETTAAEEQAQKEHDEFMNDSSTDKAAKATESEHKTTAKTNAESKLTETRKDLAGTQKELDAAMEYYEKLKPSCVDAGVSYEDRVARRKEEIVSLQEALKILNGEDLAFLQKK